MDPKEHQRLRRYYAALPDGDLRKAYGYGPAGYRDLEIWEIVSALHQERFGVGSAGGIPGPLDSKPPASSADDHPLPPAHEAVAQLTTRTPWPLEGEVVAVFLLAWVVPHFAGTTLALTYFTVTGALAQMVSQLAIVALITYLLRRDKGLLAGLGLARIAWGKELRLAGAMLVAILVVSAVGAALGVALNLPLPFDPDAPAGSPAAVRLFPLGMLMAAAYEEFVYRAYLITRLQNLRLSPLAAVVGSSVLFALVHRPAVVALSAFLIGLVLGAAFLKWQRLIGLILAHWISNWGKWILQGWMVERLAERIQ